MNERDARPRVDETLGDSLGREAAVLVEEIPAALADALDAGFNRHTSRAAEEVEHLVIPEIDARLDADPHVARCQREQQVAIREKNLVDEVHVLDAEPDQTIELGEDRRERTLAIAVPEIVLRAEAAVVRTAARRFHFSARAFRCLVESVMVTFPL